MAIPHKIFPWTLGAVCREWRTIAWSDPRIWTHPNIRIEGYCALDIRIQLATEWIQRSLDLPLSVYLHISLDYADADPVEIYDLFDVINKNSYRWYSLDLVAPPHVLAFLDSSSCNSSPLHELRVSTMLKHVDFRCRRGDVASWPIAVRSISDRHRSREIRAACRKGDVASRCVAPAPQPAWRAARDRR